MEHTHIIRDYFANTFESGLLTELESCPLLELEEGTELRHEHQSRVRYTPLVLSGSIRVTRIDESGKEILMYFIGAKESCFLNIAASLNNNFSNIDSLRAVVEEPTVMIRLSDAQIRDWNNRYSSWREYIAGLNNRRFTEFFSIIDNVVFRRADQKLIDKLNELKDQKNEIHQTHQEIAYRIGTAREVVSRLLKNLENDGKIQLSRGKIKILTKL